MAGEEAKRLFEEGNRLFEGGKYQGAVESYDKALAIDPKDAAAWYNRGNALGDEGKYQKAVESYDKALAIDPNDAAAWYNLGNALDELGKYQEAVENYDKALAIDPKDALTWYNKAVASYECEDYSRAQQCAEEALKFGEDAGCWNLIGLARFQMGEERDALDAFLRAVELQPQVADFHFDAGVARYYLGQVAEAETEFRHCLRLKKDHEQAREALGQMLGSQGALWHWWFSRPKRQGRRLFRLLGGALLVLIGVLVLAEVFYALVPRAPQGTYQAPEWQYLLLAQATCLFLFLLPSLPRVSIGGVQVELQVIAPFELGPMLSAPTMAASPPTPSTPVRE